MTLAGAALLVLLGADGSGTGACPGGQFVHALNENAAPSCSTPSGGPASDVQCTGECVANAEISALDAVKVSSGTLPAARLPNPGAGSKGGVESKTCSGTDKLSAIGTDGVPVCSADQAGAGGGPTVVRVTADVSNTSNTVWADVTGLTKAVVSGTSYAFACEMTYTSAATTTAIHLATNGPAITALDYGVLVATTATAVHNATYTGHDPTPVNPATGGGATRLVATVAGSFVPSANGTLAIRFKSEINASAVTVKRGSWCEFHTL